MVRTEEAYEKDAYGHEKLTDKLAVRNDELGQLKTKIEERKKQIRVYSEVGIEAQKLKSAAEAVQYRIDKLTRKQKAILVKLFVDRVEMNREGKVRDWTIDCEIYMRFNLTRLREEIAKGRTKIAHTKGKNSRFVE